MFEICKKNSEFIEKQEELLMQIKTLKRQNKPYEEQFAQFFALQGQVGKNVPKSNEQTQYCDEDWKEPIHSPLPIASGKD